MATPPTDSACEIGVLQLRVCIAGPQDLVRQVPDLFPRRSCSESPAAGRVAFQITADALGDYELAFDGVVFRTGVRADSVLPVLELAVWKAAVHFNAERYFLFHAGCVARGTHGLLFPGASGSGKTTIVASLVALGFEYLTDEVAAVNRATLELEPLGKALTVKAGARERLIDRFPELDDATPYRRLDGASIWYVSPPDGSWATGPVDLHYVVMPRYAADAPTALAPVGRGAGLERLLQQTFTASARSASGVGQLVEALRRAECYDLTFGDPLEAASLIQRLVEQADASR